MCPVILSLSHARHMKDLFFVILNRPPLPYSVKNLKKHRIRDAPPREYKVYFLANIISFFRATAVFFGEETTAFRVRFLLCSREKFGLVKP